MLVHHVRELNQVLENGVLLHVLHELVVVELLAEREDGREYLLEAAQGVYWSSFSFGCLEEVFGPWVQTLVWIFSRSSSAAAASGRVSKLAIRTLRMLLLHMSVERGVRKISLVAVFTLEVSTGIVILGAALATHPDFIFSVVTVVRSTVDIVRVLIVVGVFVCHASCFDEFANENILFFKLFIYFIK